MLNREIQCRCNVIRPILCFTHIPPCYPSEAVIWNCDVQNPSQIVIAHFSLFFSLCSFTRSRETKCQGSDQHSDNSSHWTQLFESLNISISNLDISALKSNSGPLFYLKVYGCAVRNEFYWQTTNQKAAILRIIHIWSWSLIIIVKVTNTSLLTLLCLNHENSKQGKCFSKW